MSTLGTTRGGGHGLSAEKAAGGHLQVVGTLQSFGQTGGMRLDADSAGGGHLIPIATGDEVAHTAQGARRLTPTECERLMGWPDGWTKPGPDSRRYSACGDGVVSYVAEWIGRRLTAELNGTLEVAA